MLSPAQTTSPTSTSRPVSSLTSRRPASARVSPSSTFPPGTAHRPMPGSRPRLTRRRRPSETTATPTPGTGRSAWSRVTASPLRRVVVVVHDDGAGGEATRFEEVLGQAMPGKDMDVELRDPSGAKHLHDLVAEGLGDTHLAGFVFGVDETDRADPWIG